jgi:hypothetical protein
LLSIAAPVVVVTPALGVVVQLVREPALNTVQGVVPDVRAEVG